MIFNENLPIYVQIMDYIKSQISSGELNEGDKLPSVRELSKQLKVNPNTIQRTYQELERDAIVFTQRGMGTFVTEDSELINMLKRDSVVEIVEKFIKDMNGLGYTNDELFKTIKDFLYKEVSEDENSRN